MHLLPTIMLLMLTGLSASGLYGINHTHRPPNLSLCGPFLSIPNFSALTQGKSVKFATSSPEKWPEFKRILDARIAQGVSQHYIDIEEPLADHMDIVVYKASQYNNPNEIILVDDSILDVEGTDDFGVNVRWQVHRIMNGEFIGRKAKWTVLLAYRHGNYVYVHEGVLHGTIGERDGNENGFGSFLYPEGYNRSFTGLDRVVSPRIDAVSNLFESKVIAIRPVMPVWDGPFQRKS